MFGKTLEINTSYLKHIDFRKDIIDKYYQKKNLYSDNLIKLKNEYEKIYEKDMILIPAGTFLFGDTFKNGYGNERPISKVTLSSFYMGKYEVTFDEYDKYCDENEIIKPNDHGWGRGKNPVINVSWIDAVTYCNYLSEKEGLEKVYNENNWSFDITKKGYRLPTEAEWEYVASGAFKGEKTIYSWGNDNPDETKLNYNYNLNKISVVGSYPSNNEFYDLLGNVWEWCNDWKNDYSSIFKVNPVGTNSGTYRVNRGGSWNFDLDYTRSTSRGGNTPSCKLPNLGFRLCRTK